MLAIETDEALDKIRHAVRRAAYGGQDYPATVDDVRRTVDQVLQELGLVDTFGTEIPNPDPMPVEAVDRVVDAVNEEARTVTIERQIAAQILGDLAARQLPSVLREEILERLEQAGLLYTRPSDPTPAEERAYDSGIESGMHAVERALETYFDDLGDTGSIPIRLVKAGHAAALRSAAHPYGLDL